MTLEFLTSVSHLWFCTTTTLSTSSHLLDDTTLKKLTHWFEFVYSFCFLPIFTGPTCEFCCFITDVQYQQVYIPLYFKRENTLRGFSMYWSSTLISLILLLPFLQRAAQCSGKRSILNTQRQWFWFTCSFWKQYPLNKTAAAALSRLLKPWHATPSHKNSSGVTLPSSYRSSTFVWQHWQSVPTHHWKKRTRSK